MSYAFVNRPNVKVDIEQAVKYYKAINPNLARKFIERLKEAKLYISKSPYSFQIKYNFVRTILLKQFPFHIHYLIGESQKKIIVLAILHAYRNTKIES
jgi:plasmid stabilization system protein ParE